MRRRLSRIALLLCGASLLTMGVACGAKKAPPVTPPPPPPPPVVVQRETPKPPPPPPAPPPVVEAPPSVPLTAEEIWARYSVDDLNNKLRPFEDAYFEFDKIDLSEAARATLQKSADYMRKWPTVQIRVEGHCDARGTAEYNLALGERRATAIRDYLVGLGVTASRITVLTKGKEAPVCTEDAEACWSQNRRGHFVVTAK